MKSIKKIPGKEGQDLQMISKLLKTYETEKLLLHASFFYATIPSVIKDTFKNDYPQLYTSKAFNTDAHRTKVFDNLEFPSVPPDKIEITEAIKQDSKAPEMNTL